MLSLGNCGVGCQLSRSYTGLASHNYVRVTVQIAFVDSWSSEWIYMFADSALRLRVQKTSSSLPVSKSEACLPKSDLIIPRPPPLMILVLSRDGLGSNICRVNYCATSSVPDDLATYTIYFFHNKSTLGLRVSALSCRSFLTLVAYIVHEYSRKFDEPCGGFHVFDNGAGHIM